MKAGEVDFTKVPGVDSSKMRDVRGDNGGLLPFAGFASSSSNSALQIASTIQDGELNKVYVVGNFTPDATNGALGLIDTVTGGTELVNGTTGTHR
jgi:hypothetical protein